jgi:predicted RNase H-like nuclease
MVTDAAGHAVVCGVDGCRGGWVVARINALPEAGNFQRGVDVLPLALSLSVIPDLADAAVLHDAACIAIDMPVGLASSARPAPRACDRLAREMLGPGRSASVFAPPCREALAATSYRDALEVNRAVLGTGISKQSYNITAKMREVDAFLAALPVPQRSRIIEVHPELSFLHMGRIISGDVELPPPPPKKHPAGQLARYKLLRAMGLAGKGQGPGSLRRMADALREQHGASVQTDDILDAVAAAWSGLRRLRGQALTLPASVELDERGIPMQMTV